MDKASAYEAEDCRFDPCRGRFFWLFFNSFFSLKPNQQVISKLEVCCTEMQSLVQVVKAFSLENGIPIHPWPPDTSPEDFDLGVVASFGHLIPERIINQFPL